MESSKIKCPNCNNEFNSDYQFCPHCGQKNREINLNLKFIISEFMAANFNLDSKILISLRYLITKPGFLSKEYISGRQTKYISPIRLYLLISFFYFFLLSFSFNKSDSFIRTTGKDDNIGINNDSVKSSKYVAIFEQDSTSLKNETISEDSSEFENKLKQKLKTMNTDAGKSMFSDLFLKYLSIGMFVLIPLSALLLFLIFHKDSYYLQHLIFALHFQSFVFLLLMLFEVIGWLFSNDVIVLISIGLVILSLVIWLKKYYHRKWLVTIYKTVLYIVGYFVIFFIFFIIVVFISFLNIG